MVNPIVTNETVELLKAMCDVPPNADDSSKTLRWKAAQRDIYIRVKAIHLGQQTSDKAKRAGFLIKSDQ